MTPRLSGASSRYIGCCGWPEGKPKYFLHSNVVELQSTFYQPPSVALAEKWRALAPPHFQYCIKAWQLITHTPSSPTYRKLKQPIAPTEAEEFGSFRPTEQVALAWERTAEIAHALQAAVVVFQCPKSFLPTSGNIENLNRFFTQIGPQPFTLAWEPRGEWPAELVQRICILHNLVHCVDPFYSVSVTTDTNYWRLHGIGGYRYRYSDEDLDRLLTTLRDAEQAGRAPHYIMFNNVWMKDDSRRFAERLRINET